MQGCVGMCSIYIATLTELITNSIIILKEYCSMVLIFDQWLSLLGSNYVLLYQWFRYIVFSPAAEVKNVFFASVQVRGCMLLPSAVRRKYLHASYTTNYMHCAWHFQNFELNWIEWFDCPSCLIAYRYLTTWESLVQIWLALVNAGWFHFLNWNLASVMV